ncbi:MAG: box helicase domain protein [Acidobacteriales bacterium]|nr:box helicase domain protein [Terriglobales bacterium]
MTNSPASSSESTAFGLLDKRIQRWIWSEGWTDLRDIQEQSIPSLINADQDVIISAATASGKTEAAFFPIISHLLRDDSNMGSVLYISPLKALINDQWSRLEEICDSLEIPVVAWHGDISASRKHRFLTSPKGILLITPESLEALFVTRGSSIPALVTSLKYVVVDELHSFIGSERGKQLQSLLHRVESCAGKTIARVALSATLGNMRLAADFLRPRTGESVRLLNSTADRHDLKVIVKCYMEEDQPDAGKSSATEEIAQDLYLTLKGTNNLIFPNSRSQVETYADLLRSKCEKDGVPNEFWAHHGNLSRQLREETEQALKSGACPATAVCTSTLELGIDIGSVRSIAQIGSPPSVASLRQRLGRSGRRRGESAILRCLCKEFPVRSKSAISDRLHEGLIQTVAMIRLLIKGWFEPPDVNGLHASTFVQQVMSVIAERSGASAALIWSLLVENGPFDGIDKERFLSILREMGNKKLIMQDRTGLLLHGELGEKLVNNYEFYSAFVSEDEFVLQHEGRTLGSLPISRPLVADQRIIFGGRRWRVIAADAQSKVIAVVPDPGGVPPKFEGSGAMIHDRVREEMRAVLSESEPILFLSHSASRLLSGARDLYEKLHLDSRQALVDGDSILLFTWRGDRVNDALSLLLSTSGHRSWNEGLAVRIKASDSSAVRHALTTISKDATTDPDSLGLNLATLIREKWDWALPPGVLSNSFLSMRMDLDGARKIAGDLSPYVT